VEAGTGGLGHWGKRNGRKTKRRFYPFRAAPARYNAGMSTIIAVILLLLAAWLAVKVVGFLFKIGLVLVAFAALYWLAAPYLSLPLP